MTLRQVAEDVELKRLRERVVVAPREDRLLSRTAPQAVGERLLALVTPQPPSQRIVRRAWRSAQRLGAELDVLIVLHGEPSEAEHEQIDAFRRLGSLLGATGLRRFSEPLTDRLLRALPGVDIRIVADRAKREYTSP